MARRQMKSARARKHIKLAKRGLKQLGKEASSIFAYGGRELTGQPHDKRKCTLKKGWFE